MDSVPVLQKEIARVQLYQALAWAMGYPTETWLVDLPDWQATLTGLCVGLELTAAGLASALAGLPQAEGTRLQTLQVEYTRLFINAVPKVLAPPYASAYTPGGLLMGQPAEAALQAYRQAGLRFAPEEADLPDHLAAELEFMFYMGREELAAREAGNLLEADTWRKRQGDFLTHHLLTWLPTWRARVGEADRTGFYAALAQLTETWLRADAAVLATRFD